MQTQQNIGPTPNPEEINKAFVMLLKGGVKVAQWLIDKLDKPEYGNKRKK